MPYASDAQRRYFNANREKLEAEGVDVDEWNDASRGKKLPKRVKKMSVTEKASALLWVMQKTAGGSNYEDLGPGGAEELSGLLKKRTAERQSAAQAESDKMPTGPGAFEAEGGPADLRAAAQPAATAKPPAGIDPSLRQMAGGDPTEVLTGPKHDFSAVPKINREGDSGGPGIQGASPQQLALLGALLGGGVGAARGALSSSTDAEGKRKSRLRSVLTNALGGAAVGGAGGAGLAYGARQMPSVVAGLGAEAAKRIG